MFLFKAGYLLQFISALWLTGPVWNGAPSNVEAAEPVGYMTQTNLGTSDIRFFFFSQ